jgi:alpha-L-fucosidase 2
VKLWYGSPGNGWNDALPIGNGRLGGMVYGGTGVEKIQLNLDTLWSGEYRDLNRKEPLKFLPDARALIAEGRYIEAQKVVETNMLGEWNESYMPMGYLNLSFDHGDNVTDFHRELDLNSAVARVSYQSDTNDYSREIFASSPDQVIVLRLVSKKPGGLSLSVNLDSQLPHSAKAEVDRGLITMKGQCPVHVEPNYVNECDEPIVFTAEKGMRFETVLRINFEGGVLTESGNIGLKIEGASVVTFLLAASTDHQKSGGKLQERCEKTLGEAAAFSYEQLLERHVSDYSSLFGRVELDLGGEEANTIPTNDRLRRAAEGYEDPALVATLFQYGRYLLISSSRPGTEAANLQGIWNDELRPPWSSNYTTNINTQMNYWPAEVCNLSECHQPMLQLIEDLRETGRETAAKHYGCRGWTAHHNVDFWRTTVPAKGRACWSFWPMGGPWLSLHMWDHYAFTQDRDFLEQTGYPAMKEAAMFCRDWLIEDGNGRLTTSPSTSPENEFRTPEGDSCAVSAGSTMDMSIIRELFGCVIAGSRILNRDAELRAELERAVPRLVPFQVGRHGQLQEWSVDFDETEPGHRHFSHLFGLFPGTQVKIRTQPELVEVFRRTLERRQDHGAGKRGWGGAWAMHFWARLEDAKRAYSQVQSMQTALYPNMFNGQSVYQIDGNLGFTSGIAEMLLQSHAEEISILPALPVEWPNGRVSGLRARGGYTVEIEWNARKANRVIIRADKAGECRVRLQNAELLDVLDQSSGERLQFGKVESDVYLFEAAPRATYLLVISEDREGDDL